MVAGAFLHLVAPFYLVALLIDRALLAPHAADFDATVRRVLQVSPTMLGGYAALALLATVAAALADPLLKARRARRRARDPEECARRSEQRLARALSQARAMFAPDGAALVDRLAASSWDHRDIRQRALVDDLAETVGASAHALATAAPARREALAAMAASALARLADAQAELAAENAYQDELKLRVAAGYVEARYGLSDFSAKQIEQA